MKMKRILINPFLILLLIVGAFSVTYGKSPQKLPGRSITENQLPDTIRRFVKHYSSINRFEYRCDK